MPQVVLVLVRSAGGFSEVPRDGSREEAGDGGARDDNAHGPRHGVAQPFARAGESAREAQSDGVDGDARDSAATFIIA